MANARKSYLFCVQDMSEGHHGILSRFPRLETMYSIILLLIDSLSPFVLDRAKHFVSCEKNLTSIPADVMVVNNI